MTGGPSRSGAAGGRSRWSDGGSRELIAGPMDFVEVGRVKQLIDVEQDEQFFTDPGKTFDKPPASGSSTGLDKSQLICQLSLEKSI